MMPLSRDQILAADDRVRHEVEVPEWGGTVFVSVMTGTERESFEREWTMSDEKLLPAYKVKMIRRCLVDEAGRQLFTDADLEALGGKNAKVIERLFEESMRVNGLQKNSVEEAVKN